MTNVSRLGLVPGQSFKAPVACVSTSNIVLSGTQTIAGHSVAVNDRVLVGGQTDSTKNGIYNAKVSTWERATDFNRAGDIVNGVQVLDTNTSKIYKVSFTGSSWSPGVTSLVVSGVGEVYIDQITLTGINNDITGIPPGGSQVVVFFDDVDMGSTSPMLLQLGGESGFKVSGYEVSGCFVSNGSAKNATDGTSGIQLGDFDPSATVIGQGMVTLERYGIDSHLWFVSAAVRPSDSIINGVLVSAGVVNLGEELTQLRLTSIAGAAAYDAGVARVKVRF